MRAKPIRLSDGAWLAGASTELGSWRPFADRGEDRAETWIRGADFEMDPRAFTGKGAIQPTLWESAPSRVHALMRTTAGWIARADSADGGIAISYTWQRRKIRSWVIPLAALDATETRGD